MRAPLVTILFLSCLLSACDSGGSNRSSPSAPPVDSCANNACSTVSGNAMLGPVVGADVKIFDALHPDQGALCELTTRDADDLQEAGAIDVSGACLGTSEYFVVQVSGGFDVDPEDDGIRNPEPTPVQGQFRALLPRSSMLANDWKVSALTEVVYQAIEYGIQRQDSNEALAAQLDLMATLLLTEDVNADGIVNYSDVIAWNPILDKAVVANIFMVEQQARAILENRNGFAAHASLSAPYLAQMNVGGSANRLALNDTHVFVAGTASVKVVDKASREITANIPLGFVTDLVLSGNTLWVAMGSAGIQAFDVSNPSAPVMLASGDAQIERLAVNDNVWGALQSGGRAKIARLLVDGERVVLSDLRDAGEANSLGTFKALDASHVALVCQIPWRFTQALRVMSTDNDSYREVFVTEASTVIGDLVFRDQQLYIAEISIFRHTGTLRSFEFHLGDEDLTPLTVMADRPFLSLAWAGDALLAATDRAIYTLHPRTFRVLAEAETLAQPGMILPAEERHWIAFGQAGLVEAEFDAPPIEPNNEVEVGFSGLRDFTYTVLQGETVCQSVSTPTNAITIDSNCFAGNGFVLLEVAGGQLSDVDNNGVEDTTPTPFEGSLSLIVTLQELGTGASRISLLGDVLYQVLGQALVSGEISALEYRHKADALAGAWLRGDVNGDLVINQRDLMDWNPSSSNYSSVVFTESQVKQYLSARINAESVVTALSAMTGGLRDIIVSGRSLQTLGSNDNYILAASSQSAGNTNHSELFLFEGAGLSSIEAVDTLTLERYVFSVTFSGDLVHVGLSNDEGMVLRVEGGEISILRTLPNCSEAAWIGSDLMCASLSAVYRVDVLTGEVRWTQSVSVDFLTGVLASPDMIAIDGAVSGFYAKLILLDAATGDLRAEHVSSDYMSVLRPFGFSNDSIYTLSATLDASDSPRLERRSIDDASILAGVDISQSRMVNSTQINDVFSLVFSDGLFSIGVDDLEIKSLHLVGVSSIYAATLMSGNWVILDEAGNFLIYDPAFE